MEYVRICYSEKYEKMYFLEKIMKENLKKDKEKEKEKVMQYQERKRWVFFGLPFTFTKYIIGEELITIDSGLLSTKENDCYMYKVQDVELQTSFMERIFGLGTIVCHTGDTTHPTLTIEHIKNAKEIKNYILKVSEEARRNRRTLNTLDIGSGQMADIDDLDE